MHQMLIEAHQHQPPMKERIDEKTPTILRESLGFGGECFLSCLRSRNDDHLGAKRPHPRDRTESLVPLSTEVRAEANVVQCVANERQSLIADNWLQSATCRRRGKFANRPSSTHLLDSALDALREGIQ